MDTLLAGGSYTAQLPAPAHVRLGWKLPHRIDPVVAEKRLTRRVTQWERKTVEVIRLGGADADKGIEAPVTVLKGSQSLGKTVAVLQTIKRIRKAHPEARGLYLTQTIDLADEIAEKLRKADMMEVEVYRGRSQLQPGTDAPMCQKHEIAATVAALGLSVSSTLCRRKLESGEVVECPFAATCAYLAQAETVKKPGLVIASQQYLSIPMDSLKDVDYVIIDESFWQAMCAIRRVDMGRFLALRSIGKRFKGDRRKAEEASHELGAAIADIESLLKKTEAKGKRLTLAMLRKAGWTKEHCEYLAQLECTRISDQIGLHPGQTVAEQASLLKDAETEEALAFRRIWLSIGEELGTSRQGKFNSIQFDYRYRFPESHEYRTMILCHYRRKTKFGNKPTLYIDANADSHIVRKFYPSFAFYRIEAKWSEAVTLDQCYDDAMSMATMQNEKHRNDLFNMGEFMAKRHANAVNAGKTPEEREARRPLMMSVKSAIDAFREEDSIKDSNSVWEHLGNTRGKDGHKHRVAGGLVSRIQPGTDALEDLARCLSADSEEELEFVEKVEVQGRDKPVNPLPHCNHWLVAANGDRQLISISYHPHWFIHRLLLQIREAEVMQALTRFRPIWRDPANPCEMFAVTNVPLGIMPSRLFTRAQMMPDRFDMMWLAGFVPERAQDIADAYPSLFPSAGAVRVAAHRREERAYPVTDGSHGERGVTRRFKDIKQGVTTLRVSYERPLKIGTREGSGWIEVPAEATKEDIIDAVRSFLPDADDLSFAMVEPEAQKEAATETPEAANDNLPAHQRVFVRRIDRTTLLRAQATGEDRPWFHHWRPNIFAERRAA